MPFYSAIAFISCFSNISLAIFLLHTVDDLPVALKLFSLAAISEGHVRWPVSVHAVAMTANWTTAREEMV